MPDINNDETKKSHANINISGDTVKKALALKIKSSEINQAEADLIWWFYCFSRTEDFTLTSAAAEIGKDSTTLYRIWTGTYNAKYENICRDIKRYKRLAEERQKRGKLDFVETSIWRAIDRVCYAALISQTVAIIYGDPQIGKTSALIEYARRNDHGQTKYMRMPASAGVQLFMKVLAKACFVSPQSSFEGVRERVLNAIDNKTLIIIDEIHQGFLSYQKGSQIKVLEVIREIYDRTHCGMVLCGTNVFKQEIQEGKLAQMLEQLRRRGTIKLQLPKRPPKADLDKIAKHFGLGPPEDLAYATIKDMLYTSGLGMYIQFLHAGATMAAKQGQKMTWEHFIQAHDIIAKLSS